MPKKSDIPLERISVKLFVGDRDRLAAFYPSPIGYSIAIRTIVRNHLRKLEEQLSRQGTQNVRTHLTNADLDALLGADGDLDGTDGLGELTSG